MNTSLRRISVMIMGLIVLLLANATFTQVFTANSLRSDPRNQRVLLDEYSRQRGQITAGGQLLAYSVSTGGRFRFLRVYPDPLVYAPVTGFYSLSYSSTGLERAEDSVLNGSDQRLFARRLADFFTGRDPRGGNVDTTINPEVQQAAWDAMQEGCSGPCQGSVVALEPSTGKILALVSSPSYDPNLLATHDLEIRGAGELLGEEQSGQIEIIGFTLYMQLLDEAVEAIRDGRTPNAELPLSHGTEMNLRIPALIPEDYLPDVHNRLMLYKRIASVNDKDGLKELQVEMIDRFGLLPDPAKNLIRQTELRLRAEALGIVKVDAGKEWARIEFGSSTPVDPLVLVKKVQSAPDQYRLEGANSFRFRLKDATTGGKLDGISRMLGELEPAKNDASGS